MQQEDHAAAYLCHHSGAEKGLVNVRLPRHFLVNLWRGSLFLLSWSMVIEDARRRGGRGGSERSSGGWCDQPYSPD
jgi:hypothetical protein